MLNGDSSSRLRPVLLAPAVALADGLQRPQGHHVGNLDCFQGSPSSCNHWTRSALGAPTGDLDKRVAKEEESGENIVGEALLHHPTSLLLTLTRGRVFGSNPRSAADADPPVCQPRRRISTRGWPAQTQQTWAASLRCSSHTRPLCAEGSAQPAGVVSGPLLVGRSRWGRNTPVGAWGRALGSSSWLWR